MFLNKKTNFQLRIWRLDRIGKVAIVALSISPVCFGCSKEVSKNMSLFTNKNIFTSLFVWRLSALIMHRSTIKNKRFSRKC